MTDKIMSDGKISRSHKILIGGDEIRAYLDNIGKDQFQTLIEMGLPVRNIRGRLYAYTGNIDRFFEIITGHRESEPEEES